jgi:hypothetical protein
MKSGDVLQVDVAFTCPFCGKQAGAVKSPPSVLHAIPYCKKFDELEAADYLKAVREKSELVS